MSIHPLASQLRVFEPEARRLPWADQRCWRCSTHLGWDAGLPLIDLHDLSVALALRVVEEVVEAPPDAGGVVLITGRGKHTGGHSKLRAAVGAQLTGFSSDGVLTMFSRGPGRFEVVFNPEAVSQSRPGMGALFWLLVVLVFAGLVASLLG